MSNVFEVEVIGKAVAQARPRFTTRGGFAKRLAAVLEERDT